MALEYRNIIKAVDELGLLKGQPSLGQTFTGTHTGGSEHYAGRAVDFGQSNNDPAAIYAALVSLANYDGCPIDELFYDPSGHGWKNGQDIGPIGGHSDHVHVGVRPGVNLAEWVKAKPVQPGGPIVDPKHIPVLGGVISTADAIDQLARTTVQSVMWLADSSNQKRAGMFLVAFLVGLEALLLVKKGLG